MTLQNACATKAKRLATCALFGEALISTRRFISQKLSKPRIVGYSDKCPSLARTAHLNDSELHHCLVPPRAHFPFPK
jgi:hypothetical protein